MSKNILLLFLIIISISVVGQTKNNEKNNYGQDELQ